VKESLEDGVVVRNDVTKYVHVVTPLCGRGGEGGESDLQGVEESLQDDIVVRDDVGLQVSGKLRNGERGHPANLYHNPKAENKKTRMTK
jgi:hypothetical protein